VHAGRVCAPLALSIRISDQLYPNSFPQSRQATYVPECAAACLLARIGVIGNVVRRCVHPVRKLTNE